MELFEIVDLETARAARGVRIVSASAIASPWSEAAKGLFRITQVPVKVVRATRDAQAEVAAWTRTHNNPVVFHEDDVPRSSWTDILALAARLGGERVIPGGERVRTFGLVSELAGEDGLAWSSRLLMIDASLQSDGARGFPLPIAKYLAPKYGHSVRAVERARPRIAEILAAFERELGDREYLVGDRISAADVYLATCLTLMVARLPEECPQMRPDLVRAVITLREDMAMPVPASLVAHRARMFERHLPTPIPL
jgi:hypothetical protein